VAEWSPEFTVDEALARRLLAGQFPELPLGSLRLVGEGWDNTVWLADGEWVFRFPRREIALPGIRRQIDMLPRLAPLLPLPVPEPVLVGEPAEGYPWPFSGARLLPGRELSDAGLSAAERAALATPLAGFLRTLHHAEVPGVDELPFDFNRRADMPVRVHRTRERLAELEDAGLWRAPDALDELLDAAVDLPPPGPPKLTHGDLHVRHLLVDANGAPSGVIDWDDMCRADPAIDLMLVWSVLPPEGRAEFLQAYGELTEAQLLRSRVLAIFLSATLALYGRHEGLPALERESLAGLERATAG
jgi:aminoglycoside phosphotransferase (APT) family kinase protein